MHGRRMEIRVAPRFPPTRAILATNHENERVLSFYSFLPLFVIGEHDLVGLHVHFERGRGSYSHWLIDEE